MGTGEWYTSWKPELDTVSSRPPPTAASSPPVRERLTPEARRRQLLEVASAIVSEHGIEKLEMRDLAARAGVTRPVVYRYFPTRHALVLALLEDFAGAMEAAYRKALVTSLGGSIEEITREFVRASCEVIELKGTGPWHLLAMRGGDPEVAKTGQAIHDGMLAPWLSRIAEVSNLSRGDVKLLALTVVATGRAVIDAWIDGRVTKKRAVEHAARAMSTLLREFAGAPLSG